MITPQPSLNHPACQKQQPRHLLITPHTELGQASRGPRHHSSGNIAGKACQPLTTTHPIQATSSHYKAAAKQCNPPREATQKTTANAHRQRQAHVPGNYGQEEAHGHWGPVFDIQEGDYTIPDANYTHFLPLASSTSHTSGSISGPGTQNQVSQDTCNAINFTDTLPSDSVGGTHAEQLRASTGGYDSHSQASRGDEQWTTPTVYPSQQQGLDARMQPSKGS